MREQQVGVADGEEGIAGGGDVRALEPGEAGRVDHRGQLHAAEIVVLPGRHQTGLAEGLERLFDLGDDVHPLAIKTGLVLVVFPVMRFEQFGCHALAGVERGVEGLA